MASVTFVHPHSRTATFYPYPFLAYIERNNYTHDGRLSKLADGHLVDSHTKKYKHSEWTQWHEAKSGRPNLSAAQMIAQL